MAVAGEDTGPSFGIEEEKTMLRTGVSIDNSEASVYL